MVEDIFRLRSLTEIAILGLAYFLVLSSIRGTRGAGILKGLIFFFVLAFVGAVWVADRLGLEQIKQMLQWLLSASSIAAIVIFAPEMRRALLRLAQSPLLSPLIHGTSLTIVEEVVKASERLSKARMGALIAIERDVGLGDYIEKGSRIDATVTSELLETIFYTGNPIHDGAVIIQQDRIAAAACFFPLTEDETLSKSMGTRHRAALGVCEETDAVVVVVSEETGRISLCVGQKLTTDLNIEGLALQLREHFLRGDRGPLFTRTRRIKVEPATPSGNGSAPKPADKVEEPRKDKP